MGEDRKSAGPDANLLEGFVPGSGVDPQRPGQAVFGPAQPASLVAEKDGAGS